MSTSRRVLSPLKPKRRLRSLPLKRLVLLSALLSASGVQLVEHRPAGATVALRATVESLTAQADLIVHAKALAQRTPKERGPQGQIYTQTELELITPWKGEAPATLTVQQLGGTLDGFTMQVSGSPSFELGAEYVLFLVKSPNQEGLYHVLSLAQGLYRVGPAVMSERAGGSARTLIRPVSQDLKGITFYQARPPQGPSAEKNHLGHLDEPAETLSLSALQAQVIRAIGAQP